eukprot:scaffold1352_cov261-Pinguiococcus_pyrenoidosus.AAC.1
MSTPLCKGVRDAGGIYYGGGCARSSERRRPERKIRPKGELPVPKQDAAEDHLQGSRSSLSQPSIMSAAVLFAVGAALMAFLPASWQPKTAFAALLAGEDILIRLPW